MTGSNHFSSMARHYRYLKTHKLTLPNDLKSLVACNIYVSAGGDTFYHRPLLTNLLQRSQDMLPLSILSLDDKNLHSGTDAGDGSVVHTPIGVLVNAYNDPVHNRSSFYLAGTANVVAQVASDLAVTAVTELRNLPNYDPAAVGYNSVAQHASIGRVDHISVMPLTEAGQALEFDDADRDALCPAARTVKRIAKAMKEKLEMQIYLFGPAHRDERPLAELRQKHRKVFKMLGGLTLPPHESRKLRESVTIGSHNDFVETYNILLNDECGKKRAQFMSRLVRESDGGLPFVEALALPYTDGRFELACNLLRPRETKPADIQRAIEKYIKKCRSQPLIEKCYHVGPTALECIQALAYVSKSNENRKKHDDEVETRFSAYFR